jgi:hypothetical protein
MYYIVHYTPNIMHGTDKKKIFKILVGNMTSKTQNCCVKHIIHKKNLINFEFFHKCLVFNFVKASFYQNDV